MEGHYYWEIKSSNDKSNFRNYIMCSFIHLKHRVFIQIKYFKTFKRKVNLTVGG